MWWRYLLDELGVPIRSPTSPIPIPPPRMNDFSSRIGVVFFVCKEKNGCLPSLHRFVVKKRCSDSSLR